MAHWTAQFPGSFTYSCPWHWGQSLNYCQGASEQRCDDGCPLQYFFMWTIEVRDLGKVKNNSAAVRNLHPSHTGMISVARWNQKRCFLKPVGAGKALRNICSWSFLPHNNKNKHLWTNCRNSFPVWIMQLAEKPSCEASTVHVPDTEACLHTCDHPVQVFLPSGRSGICLNGPEWVATQPLWLVTSTEQQEQISHGYVGC